ncbi:peptidoglycan bridge formation glycyltransferase FemA/FemB family protein [bacterium]|nr:peptidoglycan bridge formation glycyltransferase FemA/FemB family protein [bacterium]
MVNWHITDNQEEWNKSLSLFSVNSYLQTWKWGEYRSGFGWRPLRCLAKENDSVKAMVQLLIKPFPMGIGIAWVPGGPIGNIEAWSDSLLIAIKELTDLRHIIIKISDSRLVKPDDICILQKSGWNRNSEPLSTGLTLHWDLKESINVRLAKLSGNWRHNFKRSQKKDLKFEIWEQPDVSKISSLYEEMQNLKSLSQQFSFDEIDSLIKVFGSQLLIFRCIDTNGNIVAVRACIIIGNKAWDIMAAAGSAARKTYATYGTLWALAQECHLRGVITYDLGGVDPEGNKGVWNYKKGTNAALVKFLGEWEISNSALLKYGINFAIKMKGLI